MSYPTIASRRIAYDLDGTRIGYNGTTNYADGITGWLSAATITELNNEDLVGALGTTTYGDASYSLWFCFPEKVLITHLLVVAYAAYSSTLYEIQGSNDSTNGIDGTWTSATLPNGTPIRHSNVNFVWRQPIGITFDQAYKMVRMRVYADGSGSGVQGVVYYIHMYGTKAAGEAPDDILFLDAEQGGDPEFTALKDWGDRTEGTTLTNTIKLKNSSATKTANSITVDSNFADFTISTDNATWVSSLNIGNLAPGATSSIIYIKNTIGQPPQTLGPRAGRITATVGSWT